MQALVPKHRRPKFELCLKIIDLNNVPLVAGTSFVKWHLPTSAAAEHRGRTERRVIKEHKVTYDYEKHLPIRLTVNNKTKILEESWIHFDVIQEYGSGGKTERIVLGKIDLNLAEYVEATEQEGDDNDGVVRRYLMQNSKINSTLKVGIYMRQVDGDRDFIAPPLRTAQVFGGIAGIIVGEQVDTDDSGHTPTLSKNTRENGELQDMYRRTEIAFWAAQPGELRADECIEDIFSGGDGWGNRDQRWSHGGDRLMVDSADSGELSDSGSRSPGLGWHRSHGSRDSSKSHLTLMHKIRDGFGHSHKRSGGAVGRASLEQQANQMKAEAQLTRHRPTHEVDELDVRDDLKSWRLPYH